MRLVISLVYFRSISIEIELRFSFKAANAVLPDPAK